MDKQTQIDLVLSMKKDGYSTMAVAKQLNLTRAVVVKILKAHGSRK